MKSVLVANRGEIACRVFRSARALGLSTVAIYSDADAGAAHVEAADRAVGVGPAPARESYLRVEKVLEAAREAGADAIHPGYGFLSENAEFAQSVLDAGLTWIGPSPHTIRQMGDKQRARQIAAEAGVPVVPGSARFEPGEIEGLAQAAEAVGYPLLVKAAGGGGGIGMRRVDGPEKLIDVVVATQSMAQKSFNNGAVFLERFVPKARHVEMQVFGFGDGRAIHLFERDCSLQRRFQKVIEEARAPGLPAEVADAMAAAAVRLCEATAYSGAGTVEFIVDAESFEFFFLEMNTRIQVEHPVTEMITGRDLVAMQIELARGTLGFVPQNEVAAHGHAIECRLYAEDPAKMFMPSPGPLTTFRPPSGMAHLRVDSGYREGDAVTPFYDPMVAKIVVWGESREVARLRAMDALRAFSIDGIRNNRHFLLACLADDDFAAGDVHTGFIDANRGRLLAA
ncbi:acetyl-CoA carboxylase biotin carboxylase subunit [Ancylobacter sp. MQZ15Z-1]|uniref:Acetyl-CoA carboxylase biotin carboxylase subunit n=1 Tax=Ancylobacter mangrovi TaxID=2972472 RepID=A0A9X2PGC7_9HYPH|nr:biotin carboxylase N-terminal domain-containing protein [Ancylobacter mangrovi]MCS0496894.1 acetyl-CoA carboxylase biotin carboxylase subunit [Ancylobacter mangrovi]